MMLKKLRVVASFAGVAGLFVLCGICYAGDQAAGIIAALDGSVDILRAGETIAGTQKDLVQVGDRIRTKKYSRIEITMLDKSVVRLAPSTCVKIDEFVVNDKQIREKASLTLTRGLAQVTVSRTGAPDTFTLNTPNASGAVKGTDIFLSYLAGQTGFLVREGQISVANAAAPASVVKVSKGDIVTVPFNDPPMPARAYREAEYTRYKNEVSVSERGISALGEAKQMTGTVTLVSGGVRIFKKGDTAGHDAAVDETVEEGDKIITAQDGKVEVHLSNGNIISLQPESEIVVVRMAIDPESGEYDNTFESGFGKIKAVVEKIGNRSTFQIRTPVVVSGVRGTVLYMNIQPSGETSVFYEGGYGVVTSTLTGESRIVEPGQNSMVDLRGAMTAPVMTSDAQRGELAQMWKGDPGMEGPPPPGDGPMMRGTDGMRSILGPAPEAWATRVEGMDIQGAFVPQALDKMTFIDVVQHQTFVPNGSFSGTFGMVDKPAGAVVFTSRTGTVNGQFHFPRGGNYSSWMGQADGTLNGNFANPNPSLYYLFDTANQCIADDGGRFKGWIRGVMINGKLYAHAVSIDIDPTGHAGTLSAYFAGTYDTATQTFTAAGIGNVNMYTRCYLGILPSELFNLSIAQIPLTGLGKWTDSTDVISCDTTTVPLEGVNGSFNCLSGLAWGVYLMDLQGSWVDSPANAWRLPLAGRHDLVNPGDGVWMGSSHGGQWSGAEISGTFKGIWISKMNDNAADHTYAGGIMQDGRIIGRYSTGPNTWDAVGSGDWSQKTTQLTQEGMGFNIADLKTFVSVPITETAALTEAGGNPLRGPVGLSNSAFNPNSCSMDMTFYQNINNRIWTGIITGAVSENLPGSWTLSMVSGTDCEITLNGNSWADGKWHAAVADGSVLPSGVSGFSGEAAGSYEPDGSFEGVAAGTWTP